MNDTTIPPASRPHCPHCGAILLADTPASQCVRCLLSTAAHEPDDTDGTASPAGAPQPAARVHYFGDYQLLGEPLGQGGMGRVYRARQVSLQRHVALKMIHAGRFASEAEVSRFTREAEAASRLDHPHIVPLYEIGVHEGQHYLAMKLIEGESLAEHLADRHSTLSNRNAVRLLATLARAVHHAHQRGVIHRDLKPANVLLDAHGEPHLTDFGLARVSGAETRLTHTGDLLGSVEYMAPEQVRGKPSDLTLAVDIYALGCILYELLAGHPPITGATPAEVLERLTRNEPMPPPVPPGGTTRQRLSDLDIICLKCLQKEPANRYATAEALAADLHCWLRGEPITARPPTFWERAVNAVRRNPVRAALAAVTLLAVLLTSTFAVGSYRTYLWLMAKIADEHLIVPPGEDGVFHLGRGAACGFRRFSSRADVRAVPPKGKAGRLGRGHADHAATTRQTLHPDERRRPRHHRPMNLQTSNSMKRNSNCLHIHPTNPNSNAMKTNQTARAEGPQDDSPGQRPGFAMPNESTDANNRVGGAMTVNNVPVTNGLASTAIPVDPATFDGATRYLGITVQGQNGGNELAPRVLVTAVPYALNARALGEGNIVVEKEGAVGVGTDQPVSRLDVDGQVFAGAGDGHPALLLRGAHAPEGRDGTWQDIRFDFSGNGARVPLNNAGSARIRSWRGTSWDTYLEFMVNRPDEGADQPTTVMRMDSGSVDVLAGLNARRGLAVTGTTSTSVLQITGGSDLAEPFDVTRASPDTGIQPGMMMVIDREQDGKLTPCTRAYDTAVAGIISGAKGLQPGMVMQAEGQPHAEGEHPVAMTGRVWCQADAAHGPIRRGDRLTTSPTPGHAMRVNDISRAPGAVIGKAMTELAQRKGLVLVLVNLQ